MAPRKEKADKTSAEDGTQMVLGYLKRQNRPYSAIDVSSNLHNKVTKTQTVKMLKELHEKNLISGKTAGKQIVYHALQPDPESTSSPDAIAELDASINALRNEVLPALQAQDKTLRTQLNALNSSMSLRDLRVNLEQARATKLELGQRLEPLRLGTVKPVSEKERKEVEEMGKKWEKRCRARKKICAELWRTVWDAMREEGKKDEEKAEAWEELGCEGKVL